MRVRGQAQSRLDGVEHGLTLVDRPWLESLELADQEARQKSGAHDALLPPRDTAF
jgi:hypothetical protein